MKKTKLPARSAPSEGIEQLSVDDDDENETLFSCKTWGDLQYLLSPNDENEAEEEEEEAEDE